jgi:hypothetical protein
MAMVSMKMDSPPDMTMPAMGSAYGYGCCIQLNDGQCEALGFKAPLPAGQVVRLQAMAVVTESTSSVEMDGEDKGPDVRMSLQITDLEVTPKGGKSAGDLAGALYGGEK